MSPPFEYMMDHRVTKTEIQLQKTRQRGGRGSTCNGTYIGMTLA